MTHPEVVHHLALPGAGDFLAQPSLEVPGVSISFSLNRFVFDETDHLRDEIFTCLGRTAVF